jgi:hypothetical protein
MTRVLRTAEAADVLAERNRHAWNLPRQPAAGSPAPLVPSTPRARDDTAVQRVLDWQAFSSLHFPGRRRHDFEALTAYGTYRSAAAAVEPSDQIRRSVT